MFVSVIYVNWEAVEGLEACEVITADICNGKVLLDDPNLYEKVFNNENIKTELDICHALYNKFTTGDRYGLSVRQMSVGDLIYYDGRLFSLATIGWKEVIEDNDW